MITDQWHKSSRSQNTNCVEARWSNWHKSKRSQMTHCVEVRDSEKLVQMRDSKDPNGPVLTFSPERWADFINFIKERK